MNVAACERNVSKFLCGVCKLSLSRFPTSASQSNSTRRLRHVVRSSNSRMHIIESLTPCFSNNFVSDFIVIDFGIMGPVYDFDC